MSAPPGWHRQADGRDRFWDGARWTDHVRDGSVPPAQPPPVAPMGGGGFYKPWMGYVGSGVVGLVLGTAIGTGGAGDETPPEAAAPMASSAVTKTIASTVTKTATASAPAAPTSSTAAETTSKKTSATKKATTPPPVETFTMPSLVGQNLQLAQDILQKEGSYGLDQEDALGLDRVQVVDANWRVCSQAPAAGEKVPADSIVRLSSVKLTEECP